MSLMVDPSTVSAAATKTSVSRRREPKESYRVNWTTTILLMIAGLTVIIPLYFAIARSLKTAAEAASGTGLTWPAVPQFSNFAAAWTVTDFPRAFTISLLISILSVAGTIVLGSLASYAIARNWNHKLIRSSRSRRSSAPPRSTSTIRSASRSCTSRSSCRSACCSTRRSSARSR